MIFVVMGCLSFVFFYLFDLVKIYCRGRSAGFLFGIGFGVLFLATVGAIFTGTEQLFLFGAVKTVFYISALCACLLTLYALFFALPFRKTYVKPEEENGVIDTGMYALCRHPGVIFFFLMYLFLTLATGSVLMFWAMLLWTLMDVVHVWVQDRFIFPQTLKEYEKYQKSTPFLIPTIRSTRRCIATLTNGGFSDDSGSKIKTEKI